MRLRNQVRIQIAKGVWTVTCNAENRPVLWTCGDKTIEMLFDRMGRRVEYIETSQTVTNRIHRFVYDGYLCVQRLDALSNNLIELSFAWDPTEPVATRPLVMQRNGGWNFFYTHDGNKNVSDVVSFQQVRGVPAHYEYAPFGEVTVSATNTAFTAFNVATTNPYRFSSEYSDDALGLVYYNYRHCDQCVGRWLNLDPIEEEGGENLYAFCVNDTISKYDALGCNVTLMTGNRNASWWQVGNRFFHQEICVDTWSWNQKSCCWRKSGRSCYSFAAKGFGLGELGSDWLGMDSMKGPGILRGEVYPTGDQGREDTEILETTPCQDRAFLDYLKSMDRREDTYSLVRHSCRTFSQAMMEEAKRLKNSGGWENDKKCE